MQRSSVVLVLAVLGLAVLAGSTVASSVNDIRLLHEVQDGTTVAGGSGVLFWAVRLGLLPVATVLAGVALYLTARGRSARGWFIAVLVPIVLPLVARGLPPRAGLLPFYLLVAMYVAAAILATPAEGGLRQEA